MDITPGNCNNLHVQSLESKDREAEDNLVNSYQKLEDAQNRDNEFSMAIEELFIERDYFKSELFRVKEGVRAQEEDVLRMIDGERREKVCLEEEIYEGIREREELVRKIDVGIRENERLLKEIEVLKQSNEELENNLTRGLGILGEIKESLIRVHMGLYENWENGFDEELNFEGKSEEFMECFDFVWRMVKWVEEKLGDYQEIENLLKENEAYKRRNNELEERLSRDVDVLGSIEVSLIRVSEALDMKEEEMKPFSTGLGFVLKMVKSVEEKLDDYQKKVMREKRELENSVISLTEENRDVNTLLRIALIEKEAVEKSLNKLKGNNEQKRAPFLQIAERGLQRVGFGFIMGGGTTNTEQTEQQKKDNEQVSDNMASNASTTSDVSSECEEEVVSLASTVEKMMKNFRLEITQLRKALEESRSDAERLQCLTDKQAEQITEQSVYIKDLEYQENLVSQNVEELLIKIKATEEDVERWREACELEVEAGKHAVEERDKLVDILKRELEKTRASLEVSNSKLKLKEELANAAMAAQSASERSLQLADSRASGLNQRIEELTRQLEETEEREKKNKRKLRRVCWPWRALKVVNPVKRVLPEMQAFLHHRD